MAAKKKVNGKSSKSPLDHALEIARKAKADAVNIPKKPVAVKGKKTVPAALDWGKGIPEDKLAYLNDEEMALLQAHRMFKGKRSYKGVPAFPDPGDTAAGVTSGTTSGTTMGGSSTGSGDTGDGGLGQGGQDSGSSDSSSDSTSSGTSSSTSSSSSTTSSAAPASSSTTSPGTEDDDTSAAAPTTPDTGGSDTGGTSVSAPSAPAPTATAPAPSTTYSSPVTSAPSSVSTEGTLDRLSGGTSIISNPSNQPIEKDQSKVPQDVNAGTSYSTTQTIKAPSYTSGANSPFADESVTAYDPEDNVDMTGANSPFASPDVSQYDTEQYGLGPAATSPFAPKNPNEGLGASPAAPSVYSGTIPQDPAIQGVADLANQNYKTVQSGPYVSRAYSDPDLVTPSAPGSIPAPMNVPGMSYGNPAAPGAPGTLSGSMVYQSPVYDMTYGPQLPPKQIYDRLPQEIDYWPGQSAVPPNPPVYSGPQQKNITENRIPARTQYPGTVSPGGFTTPDLSSPVDTTGGNSPLSDESVQSYDPNAAPTVTRSVPAAPSFPQGELGQITEDEAAAIYGDSSLAGLPALTGVSPPTTNITAGIPNPVNPLSKPEMVSEKTGLVNFSNLADPSFNEASVVGTTYQRPQLSQYGNFSTPQADQYGNPVSTAGGPVSNQYMRGATSSQTAPTDRFANAVKASTVTSPNVVPTSGSPEMFLGAPYNIGMVKGTALARPEAPDLIGFTGKSPELMRQGDISGSYDDSLYGAQLQSPEEPSYGQFETGEPSYNMVASAPPAVSAGPATPTPYGPTVGTPDDPYNERYARTAEYLGQVPITQAPMPPATGDESVGGETVSATPEDVAPAAPAAVPPAAPAAPATSVTAPEEYVDVAPYDPYAPPTDQYVAPVDPYTLGDLAQPTNWTDAQRQAYMNSYASTDDREPIRYNGSGFVRRDNSGGDGFRRRGRFGRNPYRGNEREFIPYDYLSTDYATLPPPPNPNITTYNDYSYYPYKSGGKVGDSVDAALRLARQSVVNRNKTR